MQESFIKQKRARNTKKISHLTMYHVTADFGTLSSGDRTGVTVFCDGANVGDVVLGVATEGIAGTDVVITGAVVATGQVRLTCAYDGYDTDGASPPSLTCNIVVAHA